MGEYTPKQDLEFLRQAKPRIAKLVRIIKAMEGRPGHFPKEKEAGARFLLSSLVEEVQAIRDRMDRRKMAA